MKVLVVHNFYTRRNPSGENDAVDTDVELLRRGGAEVRLLALEADGVREGRPSDRWGMLRAGSRAGVARQLAWRPDVVHVHNPFPLLAGSALAEVRTAGVPLVVTVHNYRFTCMSGLYFRDEAPCHACDTAGSDLPGVRHGCYRGSSAQSALVALRRPRVLAPLRRCDHFFVLTEHHRRYLLDRVDVPVDAVTVRATPVTGEPPACPAPDARRGALFVGRLSAEKGVRMLLEAWRLLGDRAPVLTVVGDGQLRDEVRAAAEHPAGRIRWEGRRPPEEVARWMVASRLLVLPSTCYEGLPRVVVEAFAAGLPVVGTVLGGLRSVLGPDTGAAAPARPGQFADAVLAVHGLPDAAWLERSEAARSRFARDFSEETAKRLLLEGYARARSARG